MTKPFLTIGDANYICDICGFKFKGSQLRKTWDGYLACGSGQNDCWYPKHPFDSPVITRNDPKPVRDARPEQPDVFIETGGLSIWGSAWISVDGGTKVDPVWDELTDYWENY